MVTVAFAAAYGLTDEIHQRFIPTRSSDIYDLLCDIAGSAFAAVVLTLIKGGFNYGKRTKRRTDL
jgi:VanZ family protein